MALTLSFPLFVPADRPDRLTRAATSGADAVLADLEDAVAPDRRCGARKAFADWMSSRPGGLPVCVRINGEADAAHGADLDLVCRLDLAAIVLPKTESAAAVARVGARTSLPVIALIETARGLAAVEDIARAADLLAFGSIDYAADLGIGHTPMALHHARSRIVLAARLAGRGPPLDGVTAAVRDADRLRHDCDHAVEMGFGGKLLIHPDQVAPARAAFTPDAATLDWARRVAGAAGAGAVLVDGQMVDAPVVARARQVLARAKQGA
ncbi:MAG: CoA ester lyase [Rhodobacteraceae bacterium]|jgi:citrate lyase subunit beta/citryl-CoA lyase|nr:CoA ester lyase [Paracoccaceae bacterium]